MVAIAKDIVFLVDRAIHDAVGVFLKHENEMEVKGRLKGMINDEFHALKNMLSKSAVEDAMKDENFKS